MSEHKITHAVEVGQLDPKDCISRSVGIAEFSNGDYGVSFITKWEENAEPIITQLKLSKNGIEILAKACFEIMQNRNLYKVNHAANQQNEG